MAFSIPSGIFSLYYEVVDEFIDNPYIGESCTLVFPPKLVSCANCTTVNFGGVSKNVYAHGGPMPFNTGVCPLCGGNSIKEEDVTDTINLRIYYRTKDWIKVVGINFPQADAQIIGYLSDLPKLKRALKIILLSSWTCTLSGEPFPHGFGKDRYFVGFLKRV
jgi:hypothetical protein